MVFTLEILNAISEMWKLIKVIESLTKYSAPGRSSKKLMADYAQIQIVFDDFVGKLCNNLLNYYVV
jgi:hypothetical protein